MYPTLADLCGLPRPAWVEGVSLRALLENPRAPWEHPAYTVQVRNWAIGRSVRTARWRFTEWDEGRRGSALFDHDQDPHEMRNLVDSPQHQPIVASLRKPLRDGIASTAGFLPAKQPPAREAPARAIERE
jgi:uncharacterized sulfatase